MMFKKLTMAIASTLALLATVQSAQAVGPGSIAKGLGNSKGVQYLVARRATLAPFGFVRFCISNPADCRSAGGVSVVSLTADRERQLRSVNARVNRSIRPVSDRGNDDQWNAGVAKGDCEDYALTKRRQLLALGWSPRVLRIAVARTRSGEGHAVLVVKTSKGDLVLDNRTSSVKRWHQTDLRWVKIQSGDNPRMWYSL